MAGRAAGLGRGDCSAGLGLEALRARKPASALGSALGSARAVFSGAPGLRRVSGTAGCSLGPEGRQGQKPDSLHDLADPGKREAGPDAGCPSSPVSTVTRGQARGGPPAFPASTTDHRAGEKRHAGRRAGPHGEHRTRPRCRATTGRGSARRPQVGMARGCPCRPCPVPFAA